MIYKAEPTTSTIGYLQEKIANYETMIEELKAEIAVLEERIKEYENN